jgi:hypothetical protein
MTGFSRLLANSSILLKKSVGLQQIRGSHGRTMFIRPGKFYTKKYFDLMVFFSILFLYLVKYFSIFETKSIFIFVYQRYRLLYS